ncbi:MAG: hypothetical protein HKN95_00625 [Acidimicrobiia bacterium]|nr:hypothetical protein [Acidimicrobiia bacterium]
MRRNLHAHRPARITKYGRYRTIRRVSGNGTNALGVSNTDCVADGPDDAPELPDNVR